MAGTLIPKVFLSRGRGSERYMAGPAREGGLKANRATLLGFALGTAPPRPPKEHEMLHQVRPALLIELSKL